MRLRDIATSVKISGSFVAAFVLALIPALGDLLLDLWTAVATYRQSEAALSLRSHQFGRSPPVVGGVLHAPGCERARNQHRDAKDNGLAVCEIHGAVLPDPPGLARR
jgi:hypothetical protein